MRNTSRSLKPFLALRTSRRVRRSKCCAPRLSSKAGINLSGRKFLSPRKQSMSGIYALCVFLRDAQASYRFAVASSSGWLHESEMRSERIPRRHKFPSLVTRAVCSFKNSSGLRRKRSRRDGERMERNVIVLCNKY
jgi:hypothetical protein